MSSYSPGSGVDISIGLRVGHKEPVDLSAHCTDGVACLVIGERTAEIRLAPEHLETMRNQLPDVLAELGILDVAERRAVGAGGRAMRLEKHLRDQANAAEAAGEPEWAGELCGAADALTASMAELWNALEAVQTAAQATDDLTDDAIRRLDTRVAKDRVAQEQPAEDQAAEVQPVNGHPIDVA